VAYRQNGELGGLGSNRPITGCPVCGEQSSGFSSLPFRILPGVCVVDLRSVSPDPNAKAGFSEPSQEIGAGLGR
jgi:hypothetical protein